MTLGVEADRLRLDYGGRPALHDLSFTLDGGSVYGLFGRNGSGKTSLLSVLGAYLPPTSGTVRIGCRPVFEHAETTAAVCLVRGTTDLPDSVGTVGTLLRTARELRPGWHTGDEERLVDRFALDRAQRVSALAQGQRSALAVVLGLASRAPVTMLDECHAGMDAPTRRVFYDELLDGFMAHPRTVILSSHLIDEVAPLLEQVLVLDEGRLLLHESTDELRSRGVAVTGPAEAVRRFSAGRTVLAERHLGPTASVTLYGGLDGRERQAASAAGLELGPVGLQDLLTHLTQEKNRR